MKRTHLHVVPPLANLSIREMPVPAPSWWESPELLALAELRRAMVGGAVPVAPAQTPEEDARHAVFWALYEIEHIVREYAKLVEAGEPVRLRTGVYKHHERRVDFNLRIVEQPEVEIHPLTPRGGP
jgi:hypothetical protein